MYDHPPGIRPFFIILCFWCFPFPLHSPQNLPTPRIVQGFSVPFRPYYCLGAEFLEPAPWLAFRIPPDKAAFSPLLDAQSDKLPRSPSANVLRTGCSSPSDPPAGFQHLVSLPPPPNHPEQKENISHFPCRCSEAAAIRIIGLGTSKRVPCRSLQPWRSVSSHHPLACS
jgi:hypothetical protein